MSIVVVSYTGEEWVDVISYKDVGESITGEHAIYPRVVKLPKCEVSKSAARCKRICAHEVEIDWWDNETNRKNDIVEGRLYMSWNDPNDVMFTVPSTAYWVAEGDNEKQYVNVTMLKGQF